MLDGRLELGAPETQHEEVHGHDRIRLPVTTALAIPSPTLESPVIRFRKVSVGRGSRAVARALLVQFVDSAPVPCMRCIRVVS